MIPFLDELEKKANEVFEQTKAQNDYNTLNQYATLYNLLLQCSPIPARPIWETAIFEASVLNEASTYLSIHGFYEEACIILRTLIDGFLTRFYWDIKHIKGNLKEFKNKNGKRSDEFIEWELVISNSYPSRKEIWNVILSEDLINRYNQKFNLKIDIQNIMNELDKFAHDRPKTRHPSITGRSSLLNIKFDVIKSKEWFKYSKLIFYHISTLSILKYPSLLNSKFAQDFNLLEPDILSNINKIIGSAPAHNRA
jgi:hypothetical protein